MGKSRSSPLSIRHSAKNPCNSSFPLCSLLYAVTRILFTVFCLLCVLCPALAGARAGLCVSVANLPISTFSCVLYSVFLCALCVSAVNPSFLYSAYCILSTVYCILSGRNHPAPIFRRRRICLWHDSSLLSPFWYTSFAKDSGSERRSERVFRKGLFQRMTGAQYLFDQGALRRDVPLVRAP